MNVKRLLLTSAAFAALSISSAVAADLPVKAAPIAPPPPPFSWTGWYFGGHIGAGWARKEWSEPNCYYCSDSALGTHTAVGVLGGLQGGYNWQTGSFVLGIEGEYSWADLKGDHAGGYSASWTGYNSWDAYTLFHEAANERLSTKVKGVGTIAARFGVASDLIDRTLFYVKVGAAVVRDNHTLTGNSSYSEAPYCFTSCSPYGETSAWSGGASYTRWGWLVGAGLEYALNRNWSAKVEYNYMDFGSKDVAFAVNGSTCNSYECWRWSETRTLSVDQTLHVVKFGVNYRWGGAAWGGTGWGW
jgi:outer membrane immunogenic protein